MIITFCTDTYMPWGKVFLESFRLTNGSNTKIHINGAFLTKKHIQELKSLYPNLTIKNNHYKVKDVIERFGVTEEDYERCKKAIPDGFKKDCRWWMDFIVVEERISQLYETISNSDEEYYLHLDIDMMFRKSINSLIKRLQSSEKDVICRFRPDENFIKPDNTITPEYMRIAGGMVGINSSAKDFIKEWRDQIFTRMGEGIQGRGEPWGQTALYYAYEKYKDSLRFGQIDAKWLTACCDDDKPIWCGHKKGRVTMHHKDGTKEKINIPTRKIFRNKIFIPELLKMKKEKNKI